jgi:hypothetical protein
MYSRSCLVVDGANDVTARNNLGSGAGTVTMVDVWSGTSVSQSNNLFTRSPGYVTSSLPSIPSAADFQLTSASPAVNYGVPVPGEVWDFNGDPRDSAPDAGAWELAGSADSPSARASVAVHPQEAP